MNILINLIENEKSFIDTVKPILVKYVSNEVIIEENNSNDKIYVIKSGKVAVSTQTKIDGDEQPIKTGLLELSSGDIFGEFCLFNSDLASATVITREPSMIYQIESHQLASYFDTHPKHGYHFLKDMFNHLTSRIRTANKTTTRLLAWGIKAHHIRD
jgi:CRP-like cAMP-binding protein